MPSKSVPLFRLDRMVTLGPARLYRHIAPDSGQSRIPVLMYHGITDGTSGAHPYFETTTSPEVFARQMQQIDELGYTVLSLDAAIKMMDSQSVASKQVVITFDDGLRDFYTHAVPVLQRYGYPATMFVVSKFVSGYGDHGNGRASMTWAEVRESDALGMQIGSHTATHPQLRAVPAGQFESELRNSKEEIEHHMGKQISSFSYPYAFPEEDTSFVERLRTSLKDAGYECGVSTILGSANWQSDRYFLPRIPVNTYDDPDLFKAKLEGAYDWLHAPQWAYKVLRARFRSSSRFYGGHGSKSDAVPES